MRILVTAGPTREPIDPVRFISNYSTGTMGYEIAKAAKMKKHKVVLVSGPTNLKPPVGVKRISVDTADDMFYAVKRNSRKSDVVIMAAAVSDFKPVVARSKKVKRANPLGSLKLKKNADILSWLSQQKRRNMLVGFCMETENLLSNARKKLRSKKLDMIVANKIGKNKEAFGEQKTSVIILTPDGKKLSVKGASKKKVSGILLDKIEDLWYKKYPRKTNRGVVPKW